MESLPQDAALEGLLERHGPRVMGLLARLVGDLDEARDVYQETWCAIWRAVPRLRADLDPWPFIRQTAARKAIDHLRSRRPVPAEHVEPAAPAAPADPGPLELEMASLPESERVCLRLFFYAGCSVREIADHLSVPTGTVKTWMHRGRARLRANLEARESTTGETP